MVFFLIAGALAYQSIPKEAEPDIQIPIIYVSLTYQGISPEDSERLLLRPVETRMKSLSNVKEMRSSAYQGGGFVLIETNAAYNLWRGNGPGAFEDRCAPEVAHYPPPFECLPVAPVGNRYAWILIDDARRALRTSNALLVGMLFLAGYLWGKHARTNQWWAGIVFLVVGLALVGIAIALGG